MVPADQDVIYHRIDLVRIEESEEEINKSGEKTFIIGLDNQQLLTQIEIPPKK